MCVDFRTLNQITARYNFPLPLIEDCLGYLEGKKFITTLDLKHGFIHVSMASDSIKYTSFIVPHGQYKYFQTPFGLKDASAVYQRYIVKFWVISLHRRRYLCMWRM